VIALYHPSEIEPLLIHFFFTSIFTPILPSPGETLASLRVRGCWVRRGGGLCSPPTIVGGMMLRSTPVHGVGVDRDGDDDGRRWWARAR
jgi:hypothetical protein